MKKIIMITLLLMAGGILSIDAAFAGVIEDRSKSQGYRIRQGVISGELTVWEVKILKNEQRHIRRIKKVSRFDGRLTYRESRYIEKIQNRASRHIFRLKHNDARRYRRHISSHRNRYQ